MCEWVSTTLREIALNGDLGLVDGPFGSNLPARLYTDSGIPVIRGSNLTLGQSRFNSSVFVYVSTETAERLERSLCEANDIIFTKKGTLGQTGLVPKDGKHKRYLLSSNQMRLRVNTGRADPLYIYYYVSSPESRAKVLRDAEATGVPKTNLSYLRNFPIMLPDLPSQRRIADILGTLDDKIELNRRMNRTLEAIARVIFKSWFIDFDPVIDNAILNGKPIPDEFANRAEIRREILARSQPSPPSPLPEVEGRQYRGGFEFSGLVEIARTLRQKQTPAEEVMWELLRDRRFLGLKFRRQHQVGNYIADFFCSERRLVIELDGGIHKEKIEKDAKRDAYLESLGMTVLHFSNDQVLNNAEQVLNKIAEACEESASPAGRGGGEGVATCRDLFPDSFQDFPIGKIPKGWEISTVGEVADVVDCLHSKKPAPQDSGRLVLQVYNLGQHGDLDLSQPFWIGEDDYTEWTRRIELRSGDLVITKTGRVGAVAQIPFGVKAALGRNMVGIRSRPSISTARFMRCLLTSDWMRREIDRMTSDGTILRSLHVKAIEKLRMVLPPIELLERFEEVCHPVLLRAETNTAEAAELAQVRDALLPKLLSGQPLVAAMGEARADD